MSDMFQFITLMKRLNRLEKSINTIANVLGADESMDMENQTQGENTPIQMALKIGDNTPRMAPPPRPSMITPVN